MEQDADWVLANEVLNKKYYYIDNLHLIESGNKKFANSITRIIDELASNNNEHNSSTTPDFICEDFPPLSRHPTAHSIHSMHTSHHHTPVTHLVAHATTHANHHSCKSPFNPCRSP